MEAKSLAAKSESYFRKSQESDAHLKEKQPVYHDRYKFKSPKKY